MMYFISLLDDERHDESVNSGEKATKTIKSRLLYLGSEIC